MSDVPPGLQLPVAGRYAIERELGRGGMATVYLARDIKHKRPVALKIMHRQLTNAVGAERFLREVEIAANLTHPNILTVHDSGDSDGLLYYVMPYVAGESLRERLRGEKQLPIDEAVEIAREVAEGLAYAHAQGVIHRDVKPENILLTGGTHACVADFGIARAIEGAVGEQALTEDGLVLGTPAYMSPEQASGERDIDGRSDIYSLGCVLFEMLAGVPPFRGATAMAIIAGHLADRPPLLRALRSTVPHGVEAAVNQALAKAPADRFQSAARFAEAMAEVPLGWSSGRYLATIGRPEPSAPAVAVLPFVNMSADRDNEYFSDGMTEELINALSKLGGMRIASRTSAFAFKGKSADVREIGRALTVTHIVSGSVRKAGNRLRVAVQLVTVDNGYQLWSETYERDLSDVFAVQDEITRAITEALKITLMGKTNEALVVPPTTDVEAYNQYLKGRFHWSKRTEDGLTRGLECFRAAIRLDPDFAVAHAGIADSYIVLGGYTYLATHDAYRQAKTAALRALELDDSLAEAHTSLAYVRTFYDWDWDEADKGFRRAIALNPQYATAYQWYGQYLSAMGQFDKSITALQRALELEPLSLPIGASMGRVLYNARRYDEAVTQCRAALEMEPTFAVARAWLGMTYIAMGVHDVAIAELERAVELTKGNPAILAGLGDAYAVAGQRDKAQRIADTLAEQAERRKVVPVFTAVIYGDLGEADRAFQVLDAAYEQRSDWLVNLKVTPYFDSLRPDPRFAELLRKMRLD
ncbi:MAG: protein kinase [Gemmatimonadaceae bacterium]